MYPIDFTKCTAADVIKRSVVCDRTLFRDALYDVVRTHAEAARTIHDSVAQRSALSLCKAADQVAAKLANEQPLTALNFNQNMVAFSTAAKLQLIPHALAAEIVGRA